ncbi:helix-turn-helix domain-containing protein [Paenibacillus eucommiae]|uniref:YesN/AraC family two-component response regulator n=1 Tax=Paenibacillus eucommiae TaxID=1355755 RepID=A0ABS4J7D7_9BACL|nr:helix-turn-helix domain-containing protein [Paenibacillus eucommiae]MBP1995767.1 YesN/AraC family two-component response regulator [Paenibacillus eucommiae]
MNVKHRRSRRRSVFNTFLFSYFIILLLPVCIGAYIFQHVERTMINNENESNLGLLEQVRLTIENRFNEIEKTTLQLANDPKLQWSLSHTGGNYAKNQFDLLDIINNIKNNVINTNTFIHNFFVYFKNTDSVLYATGQTDAETYFNGILRFDGRNAEQVKQELLSGSHFRTYKPSTVVKEGEKESSVLTYIQSLPIGEKEQITGYLVALIKEQEFYQLIEQIEKINHSQIYIVDEHQQILMSTSQKKELNKDTLANIREERGYHSFQQDGQSMILSYTTDQRNWTYISIIPKKVVLGTVITLKNWSLSLVFLLLIAGFLISFLMARRNFSPISDVVAMIKENKQSKSKQSVLNEYDFIKQSILHSIDEKNGLKEILDQQKPVIQANFLSRLIKGHVDVSDIFDDSLKFMGIYFKHDYFSVHIIEVDDCQNFITEDTEREWALVRFVLTNLSRELLGEDDGYVVEMDRNRLALLFNTSKPDEQTFQQRNKFVRTLQDYANQRFRFKITIAVSQFVRGLEGIGRCYQEALIALDSRLIYGSSEGIYYEDIAGLEHNYYEYALETEVQLMNYAKNGDFDNVERLLDQIYEANFVIGGISPELGKCLFYDLLSTILKLRNGFKTSKKRELEGIADPLKSLAACSTAEEMLWKIKEFYKEICVYTLAEKNEHRDQMYTSIIDFVESHYFDSNLSVALIADHFRISPQYLSSFFKKHSGENISDYIAKFRIMQAKKMLTEQSLTLAEIASRIGYSNDAGFVRFFKKYEGITPGKYRDNANRMTNIQGKSV